MTLTIESGRDWRRHWNGVVKRTGPEDFLRQVERTIGGEPMDKQQIFLSVQAACETLQLEATDYLLDLCCGNGLITVRLAAVCHSVDGVDFSSDLIRIAKLHHAASNIRYFHSPAAAT